MVYSSQPDRVTALSAILLQAGGFDLSPAQNTVQGLHCELAQHPSALVLVEIGPEMSFDTLRDIRRASNFKIVLWADAVSSELAFEAMGLGIRGILRNSLPAELQLKCLRDVAEGALWYEKIFLESLVSTRIANRTQRESRLVDVLAEGLKIKGLAGQMMVPCGGVKACLSRLLCKTGVVQMAPNAGLAMTPWADLINREFRSPVRLR